VVVRTASMNVLVEELIVSSSSVPTLVPMNTSGLGSKLSPKMDRVGGIALKSTTALAKTGSIDIGGPWPWPWPNIASGDRSRITRLRKQNFLFIASLLLRLPASCT